MNGRCEYCGNVMRWTLFDGIVWVCCDIECAGWLEHVGQMDLFPEPGVRPPMESRETQDAGRASANNVAPEGELPF